MTTRMPTEQERQEMFLHHPDLWPIWPILPLKNPERGSLTAPDGLGFIHGDPTPGYPIRVLIGSYFIAGEKPIEMFDTPDDLWAAGWRID